MIVSKWEKPKLKKSLIKSIEDYMPETMEAGLDEVSDIVKKTGLSSKEVIELLVKLKAIKKFNLSKEINNN